MKAKFYGIPCYYTESTNTLEGRNEFYEILLNMMAVVHCGFSFICEAFYGVGLDFPIFIEEEIEK